MQSNPASASRGKTVVITAKELASPGMEVLENAGCKLVFVRDGTVQSLLAAMQQEPVHGILCRSQCPGEVLRANPALQIVSRHGVGYDSVDVATASALGIPVTIAAGANAQSVAELVFGLLGAVARDLVGHTGRIRGNVWERAGAGMQLQGKTMGIVGLGFIGSKVAALAQAYGMNVVAYDIRDRSGIAPGVELVGSLQELLRRADVVSLHTPRTPQTEGMMDAAAFGLMRQGAVLINTARGEVVDEAALHAALASGQLRGAGFDVHAFERPEPGNPLRQLPNVVMSPHIGAQTDTALQQVARVAAQNIIDLFEGKPLLPEFCVNLAELAAARPAAVAA